MDGQMDIFDYLKPSDKVSLEDMPEEEMVRRVGTAVGLDFKYDKVLEDWRCKVKDVTFDIHFSRISVEPFTRYISCGWSRKTEGCGSPCDSIRQAVEFFKKGKEKWVM